MNRKELDIQLSEIFSRLAEKGISPKQAWENFMNWFNMTEESEKRKKEGDMRSLTVLKAEEVALEDKLNRTRQARILLQKTMREGGG
jgi:hypothetical protein